MTHHQLTLLLLVASLLPALRAQDGEEDDDGYVANSYLVAFYYTGKPASEPAATLRKTCQEQAHFQLLELKSDLETEPKRPSILLVEPTIEDYPPPDAQQVKLFGRGLSPEQAQAVQKAEQVMLVTFVTGFEDAYENLLAACQLAYDVGMATGALLWDEELRQLFTPQAWKAKLIDKWQGNLPDVRNHMVFHFYQDGEFCRSVSLGMGKLCLPDVELVKVPRSFFGDSGQILNLLCQTMVEHREELPADTLQLDITKLKHAGAKADLLEEVRGEASKKARVRIVPGEPQEGDCENVLIRLDSKGFKGKTHSERMSSLANALFGVERTAISVDSKKRADEIEELSRLARERLVEDMKPRFLKGLELNEQLHVKAPFETKPEGKEYMWVEVTGWKGATIKGVLLNVPEDVPGLRQGATVEIDESTVFDYLHTLPSGETEGNETQELLHPEEEEDK